MPCPKIVNLSGHLQRSCSVVSNSKMPCNSPAGIGHRHLEPKNSIHSPNDPALSPRPIHWWSRRGGRLAGQDIAQYYVMTGTQHRRTRSCPKVFNGSLTSRTSCDLHQIDAMARRAADYQRRLCKIPNPKPDMTSIAFNTAKISAWKTLQSSFNLKRSSRRSFFSSSSDTQGDNPLNLL